MPLGGPTTGTGLLVGTLVSDQLLENRSENITVTPGSLVGSLLIGDLFGPQLGIGLSVGGDLIRGGEGADTVHGDTAPVGPFADSSWNTRDNFATRDDIFGNGGNDVLNGGSGYDVIYGGTGNDIINMQRPDRVVDDWIGGMGYGGTGSDSLYGLFGRETLAGGDGMDLIYAGAGNDFIFGGAREAGNFPPAMDRADTLFGQGGNDTMGGDRGDDLLYGGDGDDSMRGGESDVAGAVGRDTLYGGAGNDTLSGNEAIDRLYGGTGDDKLIGGRGADWIYAGAGNDTLDSVIVDTAGDHFVFNTALNALTNVDTTLNFTAELDRLVLDRSVFGAIGSELDASEFKAIQSGTSFASVDASDHIIYVRQTGQLYYDVDGEGGAARTLFAIIDAGRQITLTLGNFDIQD